MFRIGVLSSWRTPSWHPAVALAMNSAAVARAIAPVAARFTALQSSVRPLVAARMTAIRSSVPFVAALGAVANVTKLAAATGTARRLLLAAPLEVPFIAQGALASVASRSHYARSTTAHHHVCAALEAALDSTSSPEPHTVHRSQCTR